MQQINTSQANKKFANITFTPKPINNTISSVSNSTKSTQQEQVFEFDPAQASSILHQLHQRNTLDEQCYFKVTVDVSNFQSDNKQPAGVLIHNSIQAVSSLKIASINELSLHGKFYYDVLMKAMSTPANSGKKEINVNNGCCSADSCPITLFYQVLANNGKLTRKHKLLKLKAKGGESIAYSDDVALVKVNTQQLTISNSIETKNETRKTEEKKCNFCGKCQALKVCSKCKCTRYCGRECQVQDYSKHKLICCNNICK